MMQATDKKQSQRNYLREWRRKNPEKARQHNVNYWKRRLLREQQLALADSEGQTLEKGGLPDAGANFTKRNIQ